MELLDKIVTGPLKDFGGILIKFLPNLLSSLIVFAAGLICGKILKVVTVKSLSLMSADKFFSRVGISRMLEKGGIKDTPAELIGRIFFWLLVAVFSIIALYTLNVPTIEILLEKFLLYLPNFFIAILIIVAGYLLSNFVETAVLIASVNAGIKLSKQLSIGVKFTIILIATTMAMEQLGIGHDTVLVAFTLIFGGVVFAFSLAFGLAGKDIALKYLEKKLSGREESDDGIQHL